MRPTRIVLMRDGESGNLNFIAIEKEPLSRDFRQKDDNGKGALQAERRSPFSTQEHSHDPSIQSRLRGFPLRRTIGRSPTRRMARWSPTEGLRPGGRKRRYQAHFVSKLTDADAEATETMIWLDFSLGCGYVDSAVHTQFSAEYEQIGKMLGAMISEPEKFCYATKKSK